MNLCIIQARTGSTRLPNKVLLKVNQTPVLEYEIKRAKQSKSIDKIVVATTMNSADDWIAKLCRRIGVACFRGSENDVLDRYYQCSRQYPNYQNIVRITGDCPLIDPLIIDQVIALFKKNKLDYASNCPAGEESYPDGLDTEIFTKEALRAANQRAKLGSEREHVTTYLRKNKKFSRGYLRAEYDFSHFRLTLDEPADYEVIKFLIKNSSLTDGYLKYISLLTKNPQVMFKNTHISRNEGFLKSLKNDHEKKF